MIIISHDKCPLGKSFSHIIVHPCDKESKGGCDQVCNKKNKEEASCACQPIDFSLNKDGKSCDPGIPHNSLSCGFLHTKLKFMGNIVLFFHWQKYSLDKNR